MVGHQLELRYESLSVEVWFACGHTGCSVKAWLQCRHKPAFPKAGPAGGHMTQYVKIWPTRGLETTLPKSGLRLSKFFNYSAFGVCPQFFRYFDRLNVNMFKNLYRSSFLFSFFSNRVSMLCRNL